MKFKTSAVDNMSDVDRSLLNRLVILCGTYYDETCKSPSDKTHRDPERVDNLKREILLLSHKVGERVWHPRRTTNGV